MPTKDYLKAKIEAEAIGSKLSASDPRYNYTTHIVMSDGSVFITSDSFIVEHRIGYGSIFLFVFAEHYETRVIDPDEVEHYGQYKRTEI